MAENATATETAAPEMTDEEKKKIFDSLLPDFQEAIRKFNVYAEKHNQKVEAVKAAESQDPKRIKAEIYEQNSGNNKKLARIREQELKLLDQVENLRKQAYEVIDADGLMPKDLSPEEVEKLKGEITEGNKELKDQAATLAKFEDMMPMLKGKLVMHLSEVKTRRGTGASAKSSDGTGPKRPRFKKIEINGVTQDDKGNTVYALVKQDGEDVEKYNFGLAANYLKKQHRGMKVTTKALQDLYFEGEDEDNLPEVKEFVWPYTFKDEAGNEHTVNYTIKAYR